MSSEINYGRSKPRAEQVYREPVQRYVPNNQSVAPQQAQQEYIEPMVEKKRFFQKKDKKEKDTRPVSSDNLFREINLFIPELVGLIVSVLASVFLLYFTRYTLISGLESVREQMLPETYTALANVIGTANMLYLLPAAIPLLFFAVFFLYRFMTFMPTKDRYLFMRIKNSGAIKLSVQKLASEVKFDGKIDTINMKIRDPRLHVNESTGKPIIVLREGDDANTCLIDDKRTISERGKATNGINTNAIDLGKRLERYNAEESTGFFSLPNIIAAITLAGVAFLGMKQMGFF